MSKTITANAFVSIELLGERLIGERRQGNYSTVRFDKLFINDRIYKYYDSQKELLKTFDVICLCETWYTADTEFDGFF